VAVLHFVIPTSLVTTRVAFSAAAAAAAIVAALQELRHKLRVVPIKGVAPYPRTAAVPASICIGITRALPVAGIAGAAAHFLTTDAICDAIAATISDRAALTRAPAAANSSAQLLVCLRVGRLRTRLLPTHEPGQIRAMEGEGVQRHLCPLRMHFCFAHLRTAPM